MHKVHKIEVKPSDCWIVPGDIHFDQEDSAALGVMTDVMIGEGVNGMVLIGDTHNSMGISRHVSMRTLRNMRVGGTVKSEKEHAKGWLPVWADLIRMRRQDEGRVGGLHAIEGNHEKWWSAVQDEFPGLIDTHWSELFGDLYDGWQLHKEDTALKLASLLLCHGHRTRGSLAKRSAYSVLREYPSQNTLYGHTHRQEQWIGATFKDGLQEFHGAWTVGHMRDRDSELNDPYSSQHAERHRQGFGLIHFYDRGADVGFHVNLVPIERDSDDKPFAVVNGKVYH